MAYVAGVTAGYPEFDLAKRLKLLRSLSPVLITENVYTRGFVQGWRRCGRQSSCQRKDKYPTAKVFFENPEIAQQVIEAYPNHEAGPFTNAPTTCGFVSLELLDP
ncbi:hypothetical protein P171DRAFT_144753 [Karstenula rhodostoma CBS 690.94]|uniref:Uncharacterized protein n=1 Tax=Karstenula rhodostoma CBS 690.94 TaxID=1392251 RepID=A0A9P4UIW0_9PLEO|nr:hypothetical protein P171DRAFT_144753 [Karstenula rhodostoma CBS 690.94]